MTVATAAIAAAVAAARATAATPTLATLTLAGLRSFSAAVQNSFISNRELTQEALTVSKQGCALARCHHLTCLLNSLDRTLLASLTKDTTDNGYGSTQSCQVVFTK
jgi:hypothetical protein